MSAKAVSYVEWLQGKAALWDAQGRDDAAIARALAALVEQIESSLPNIATLEGRENECVGYCIQLAAGYTPPEGQK